LGNIFGIDYLEMLKYNEWSNVGGTFVIDHDYVYLKVSKDDIFANFPDYENPEKTFHEWLEFLNADRKKDFQASLEEVVEYMDGQPFEKSMRILTEDEITMDMINKSLFVSLCDEINYIFFG
jgi:hypothetical protein